MSHWQFVR